MKGSRDCDCVDGPAGMELAMKTPASGCRSRPDSVGLLCLCVDSKAATSYLGIANAPLKRSTMSSINTSSCVYDPRFITPRKLEGSLFRNVTDRPNFDTGS